MSVIQIDGVEIGFSTDGKQAFARKNGIATPLVDLPAPYSLGQQLIGDLTRLLGRMSTRVVALKADFDKVDKPSHGGVKNERFEQYLTGVILLMQEEIDRITRMKGFTVPARSGSCIPPSILERMAKQQGPYKTLDPTTLAERVSSQLGELNQ